MKKNVICEFSHGETILILVESPYSYGKLFFNYLTITIDKRCLF